MALDKGGIGLYNETVLATMQPAYRSVHLF